MLTRGRNELTFGTRFASSPAYESASPTSTPGLTTTLSPTISTTTHAASSKLSPSSPRRITRPLSTTSPSTQTSASLSAPHSSSPQAFVGQVNGTPNRQLPPKRSRTISSSGNRASASRGVPPPRPLFACPPASTPRRRLQHFSTASLQTAAPKPTHSTATSILRSSRSPAAIPRSRTH